MPVDATIFRVFIASTSDLAPERQVIRDTILEWSEVNGYKHQVYLEPVLYESHIGYDASDQAQRAINQDLVDTCDLLIAIFWKRLGTPTEGAASGTMEELQRFREAKRPTMLCFKEGAITHSDILEFSDDLRVIAKLKAEHTTRLTVSFDNLETLKASMTQQIAHFARDFVINQRAKRTFSKKDSPAETSGYEIMGDLQRIIAQSDMSRGGDNRILLPAIQRIVDDRTSIRVLDFGCGNGYTTRDRFATLDSVGEVVGVDVDHQAIEMARSHCAQDDRFKFIVGDIEQVRDDIGLVDIVFVSYVLDHLPDPAATLDTLWQMLRSGGSLIARTVDDALSLTYPASRNTNLLIDIHPQLKGSSDKTLGRRLYSILRALQPTPAKVIIDLDPIINASTEGSERHAFFEINYSGRYKFAKALSANEGGAGPDTDLYHLLELATLQEWERFRTEEDIFSAVVHILGCATKK